MWEQIRLASIGVIDEAELELGPGFVVITGETGAGKTMVVTSLDLLCGGRADPGLVRRGESRSRVEARILVVVRPDQEMDRPELLEARLLHGAGRRGAPRAGRGARSAAAACRCNHGHDRRRDRQVPGGQVPLHLSPRRLGSAA